MGKSPRQQWAEPLANKTLSSIPERRSSRNLSPSSPANSMLSTPSQRPPRSPLHATPKQAERVPPRGRSSSPIRRSESHLRRAPSRTFVPANWPTDLMDTPKLTHPRVSLELRVSSPIFMGGATVEGEVCIAIDGGAPSSRKSQPTLSISRMSVSLVGIERCKGRSEMFRALTTDLIDEAHPPPTEMAPDPGPNASWDVTPSSSILAFRLDLPVVMGPSPYKSKRLSISYLLSTLVEAKIADKNHFVRQSREIVVLTVHDPEKALVNLSNPLVVYDGIQLLPRDSTQKIMLTAGLHRQTWISGYLVFVDIHISNQSSKTVKKIELQLEKTTTFHKYSAPSTTKGAGDLLRLPDSRRKELVARKEVRDGFRCIRAQSQDSMTCQMELPTGLVSIETGRFFGIRYFLNIQVTCSFNKRLKVQLPITIIHPSSIDIPPNALAQVTASIEHKHRNLSSASGTGSPYRYRPGQAFSAARRRSYLQLRRDTIGSTEMNDLSRTLEASPRKFARQYNGSPRKMKVTRRTSGTRVEYSNRPSHHRAHHSGSLDDTSKYTLPRASVDTMYPPHQHHFESTESTVPRSSLETKVLKGLRGSYERKGPRLQRSTSGLGFDDSDKENRAPKV